MQNQTHEYAIEVENIARHFGKTRAVDGIDLKVKKGGVFGVLGPNGAGKTTLIRMLSTLIKPTSGTARVMGHDIIAEADLVRSKVSLTGQFASVDEDLNGMENLILIGRLYGYSSQEAKVRAQQLIEGFELSDAAKRQVKTYSGGMRRRLDIAVSIVIRPDLLFLDEPTTGLDPRSRNQVWEIIRSLVGDGTTVLLTTQYLDEADQLAERIAVIDHGKVIAEGSSSELKASVGSGVLRVRLRDPERREEASQIMNSFLSTETQLSSDPFEIIAQAQGAEQAAAVISKLSESGINVTDFSLGQPSLDEVFLAITGRPAEPETEEQEAVKKV